MLDDGEETTDKFFYSLGYSHCVYLLAVIGILSQVGVAAHNIVYLRTGHGYESREMEDIAEAFSTIGITLLLGSAVSEIVLAPAIKSLHKKYIQWWMTFMMLLLILSVLMTVVAGFVLHKKGHELAAYWIAGSYLLLVIRVPLQMFFVDGFSQCKIFHKELHMIE